MDDSVFWPFRGQRDKAMREGAELDECDDNEVCEIIAASFRGPVKAGSDKAEDTGSMIEAQKLLGHAAASTTEIYVRHRRGALVKPTR